MLIPWLFLGMLIAFTPALVVSLSGGWRSEGPNLLRWRVLQLLVIVAFVAMFIFIGCVLFPVQVRPPVRPCFFLLLFSLARTVACLLPCRRAAPPLAAVGPEA